MVVVPAGSVMIGSPVAETSREIVPEKFALRERPQKMVTIAAPFAVSRTEITRAQWAAFAKATARPSGDGCYLWDFKAKTLASTPGKSWRDPGFPQSDQHPVTCVSWDDAAAYAAWMAAKTGKPYRLLTEGEWEYAARAGTTTARPWGDGVGEACAYANVFDATAAAKHDVGDGASTQFDCRDGYAYTAPVGRFRPNAFGLHDMLGNLAEWVQDCADNTTLSVPADGSAYAGDACKLRRFKGGSWRNSPLYVRSANRFSDPQNGHYGFLTIRLARAVD